MKRQDYLSWDAYFMGVALLSAQRSKDNNTQVGSCIVDPHNKILSMGYNGMPTGCSDDRMPWERKGTPLDTKYLYVCHAELNSILNYSGRLYHTVLYKKRLISRKETISNNKGSRYFLNDLCDLGMDNNRNVPSCKRDS